MSLIDNKTAVAPVTDVQDAEILASIVTHDNAADVADVTQEHESLIPSVEERPCYRVFDDWYEEGSKKFRAGVWYFFMASGKGGEEPTPAHSWICSPLHVEAITFDGQENNFGRLLKFRNSLRRWREWAMPMELLKGTGEELRGELMAMGLEIDHHNRTMLPTYLQSRHPSRKMRCAMQVGWCKDSFVLPDVVIGKNASEVIFQSGERFHDEYTFAGSLEGWKSTLSRYATGNPALITALSGAFTGALLEKCNAESGGIHFVGDFSSGKTGLIEAACSVWGGKNYKRSWRSTANGMEGVATMFNDGLLALDEISECDPRDVDSIVYSLGNGRGKQRASRTGNARSVKQWRLFVLSSGERTLETAMAEGGKRIKAGHNVRLPSVPVSRSYGVWDELHGMTGAALTDSIKNAAKHHYGVAGRAFLERLTQDNRNNSEYLERIKASKYFAVEGGEGQIKRVAARFALVALAGELATEYGVTGWPEGTAIKGVSQMLQAWVKTFGGSGNDEHRQIIERVSAFIERHGDSRFSDAEKNVEISVRDRAGWWRDDDAGRSYLFTADGMREALKGFDFKRALDELQVAGALPKPDSTGERAKNHRINGRQVKLYQVYADKLRGQP